MEWEDDSGATCQGVFIPRRDTDSKLNAFAGGRLFPGVHHLSSFTVIDDAGVVSVRVVVKGCDEPLVDFEGCETDVFPEGSAFGSLQAASEFFKAGSLGYSSRPCSCTLDGLLLKVPEWNVRPLAVHRVKSSFLDDRSVFPRESIQFDHALVMRDCLHEWHSKSTMSAEGSES